MSIDSSDISGQDSIALHQELENGQGPFVAVEVSFDGQHFTSNRLLLELIEPLNLLYVSPANGPLTGGSLLQITTEDILRLSSTLFSYDAHCMFNSAIVSARVVGNGTIECIAPPYLKDIVGGTVELKVTINGQDASNGLEYRYDPHASLLFMSPSFGTIMGDTIVNISGTSIIESTEAYCSFDDMIVKATSCTKGLIQCRTPAVDFPKDVHVTFTLNRQDYANNTLLYYSYQPSPIVTRIDPFRGPITDATNIKVSGQYFLGNSSFAQCRFGDIVVPAVLNTMNTISCAAPELPQLSEVQTLTIAQLPINPSVVNVTIESAPLEGDVFELLVQGSDPRPQEQTIQLNMVTDVDEVQVVSIGASEKTAHSLVLRVEDSGRLPAVQQISTSAQPRNEIQSIFFVAPSLANGADVKAKYPSIQSVSVSDTSAIVTLVFALKTYQFSASSSTGMVLSRLQTVSGLSDFTVTAATSNVYGSNGWVITFPVSLGNLPTIYANVTAGSVSVRSISQGGSADIQLITFQTVAPAGEVTISFRGQTSPPILQNASEAKVKQMLEDLTSIGFVSVTVSSSNALHPTWQITFLQCFGDLPLLSVTSYKGASVQVTKVLAGTTSTLSGTYSLTVRGDTTTAIDVNDDASAVQAQIQALVSVSSVVATNALTVKKYNTLNGGFMLLIEFSPNFGDVPPIVVDSANLLGKFQHVMKIVSQAHLLNQQQ